MSPVNNGRLPCVIARWVRKADLTGRVGLDGLHPLNGRPIMEATEMNREIEVPTRRRHQQRRPLSLRLVLKEFVSGTVTSMAGRGGAAESVPFPR